MKLMPHIVREKYDSLPPSTQNNARQMFRSDWERIGTSESKEMRFAEKWGFVYESKYVGEANHAVEEIPDYSNEDQLIIKGLEVGVY